MTVTAKITSKGQITLPKEIRALLDLREGGVIVFEKENNRVVIKPAKTLKDLKGVLKGERKVAEFNEMRKKAKEYVGKKAMNHGRP